MMKISATPTNWLLLKASTDSNFRNTEFILVEMTNHFKETLAKRLAMLKGVSELDDDLTHITFFDYPEDFYTGKSDDIDIEEQITDILHQLEVDRVRYAYVDTTQEEVDLLEICDIYDDIVMEIYRDGEFMYRSDDGEDRYWTSRVSVKEIIGG
jgi:hypothetical protein